jgi:predicted ATPase/DNA-binding CsgD family transcriptional regulator
MRPNAHNLPSPATPLVGRARELADVRERLLGPDVRLLTLTGAGGTGKTRLALAAATDALDAFPDGVWLVNLDPVREPAHVVPTIAQTLGVKERAGEPLLAALSHFLRARRLLLLLDNFEQVVAAAADVASLLEASAQSKLLVTSRTPLHVYGEHQYPVPPLGFPDLDRLPPPEAIARYEAVALFLQRAQAAHAGFRASPADLPAVAEISSRLDGVPLAIELAAARIRVMPPPALLARLDRRLPMLTGGARNLPARQQTIRATIDWSYELLDEHEQALFRRLSVFAGGCTLELAETVCRPSPEPSARGAVEPPDVVDALASLVDKSLLERRDGLGGEPRFVMLETLREYAGERLESSGEAARLREAHADAFLALVERADAALAGGTDESWLARLDQEHENLRAALTWTIEHGRPEVAVRMAGELWRFWFMRGHLTEGQRTLERALAAGPDVSPVWRGGAMNAAGNLALARGEWAEARDWQEQSLALYRGLGNRSGVAATLINLGNVALDLNDYERAGALYEECLALYRELGDRGGTAMALNNLGLVAREMGRPEEAIALLEESLALRRALGDRYGIAQVLDNLGRVELDHGDLDPATRLLREGLALFWELGNRLSTPLALEDLATATALGDDPARAARLWGAAESLRVALGAPMPQRRRPRYETAVASARARLGEGPFAEAWAAGAAMTADEAVASALRDEARSRAPSRAESAADPLTARERQVAALIARGLTSREIAAELIVSERTVDAHADHIRSKLGVRSRAEIAAWIARQGAEDGAAHRAERGERC